MKSTEIHDRAAAPTESRRGASSPRDGRGRTTPAPSLVLAGVPPPWRPGVHRPAGEGAGGAWHHHRGGPHDRRPTPRRPAAPRPRRPKRSAAARSPGHGAPTAATPRAGCAPPPASPKPTRAPGAYPISGTTSLTASSKVGASAAAPLPSGPSYVQARTPEALLVAGAPTRFRRRRECARATSSWEMASWEPSAEGAGAVAAERRTCRCGDDAAPTRGRRRS